MKKLLLITLVAILALIPAGTLFAQSDSVPSVHCGDLAEADCELLTESRAAMEGLTAAASLFQFDADLSSLLNLPSENGALGYTQETRFVVEPEVLEAIQTVSEMDADALAAHFSDSQAFTDFIMQLVLNTDLEQTFTLDLSGDLADSISTQVGMDLPPELMLQYALVDGILYLQLEQVAELIPALGFLDGWVGFDVSSAITLFAEDGTLTPPENLEEFQAGLIVPGIAMTGMGALGEDQESAMFDEHKTVVRLGDSEFDGTPVAVYATTLDLVSLLTDPDVQSWLIDLLGEDLMASLGMSKENLGAMPMLLAMAGPLLFNELDYSILQSVGIEDAYLYYNEVTFNWDLSRLRTMVGAENNPDRPVVMDVVSINENSEFNNAVITAPEGALVLPVAMIVQLLGAVQQ
jgi:hypothetical protein